MSLSRHLDIACYPKVPLLFIGRFAPPEDLSITSIMSMRYHACHMSRLLTRTMERCWRCHDYMNHELVRLLLMLTIKYAGSVVVCMVLGCLINKRASVLSIQLEVHVESVIATEDPDAYNLLDLIRRRRWALGNVKNDMTCNPSKFRLRRHNSADTSTAYVPHFYIPIMPLFPC